MRETRGRDWSFYASYIRSLPRSDLSETLQGAPFVFFDAHFIDLYWDIDRIWTERHEGEIEASYYSEYASNIYHSIYDTAYLCEAKYRLEKTTQQRSWLSLQKLSRFRFVHFLFWTKDVRNHRKQPPPTFYPRRHHRRQVFLDPCRGPRPGVGYAQSCPRRVFGRATRQSKRRRWRWGTDRWCAYQ